MSLPIKLQLPEHFLDEEIRCETVVTTKMKKIWAVMLDLTEEFRRVCDKYDLEWYAMFGTLLGAVRHNGFIPWDNDMDFIMPRKDFQKLCEIGEKEFKSPYYFKTPVTEQGRYYQHFAKIGNELTTGESEQEWLQGTKSGIFIDIFILDDFPKEEKTWQYIYKQTNEIDHLARFLSPYNIRYKGIKLIKHWMWYLIWKFKYNKCKGDALFEKWSNIHSNIIPSNKCYTLDLINEGQLWDKSLWEPCMINFEFTLLPCPVGYDTILKSWYGDYMQFPPVEKRVNHEYFEIEPEIPYKEYFSKKYGK